jgi:hypothetical protein
MMRRVVCVAVMLCAAFGAGAADETWTVAGQQGLVRAVIVPTALASNQEAYAAQVKRLCEAGATCFLNFYTNSTGVPVSMPLPDAIERESTAVFRRSAKQVAERFTWRCSLKLAVENCF